VTAGGDEAVDTALPPGRVHPGASQATAASARR